MLNTLSIQNFKSWKEIRDLRLAPITGLFGANSSGKSSILQLLLLLKQTVESPDRAEVLSFGGDRSLVSLGTFEDIIHRHQITDFLWFMLGWTAPQEISVAAPDAPGQPFLSGRQISFTALISRMLRRDLEVGTMGYWFDGLAFGMVFEGGDHALYPSKVDENEKGFHFRRRPGRPLGLPAPVKFYGFPHEVNAFYENAGFLADFALALEQQFGRMYYLGPLREHPQRQYTWGGAQPADVGQRGERVIDALLASRSRGSPDAPTVEEHVARWLRELGLIYDFSVREITAGSSLYQVWVRKTPDAAKVLLTDVGFGVSQILPVIALCYYVPEGSTIILEQPEIHLHPSVQAGLADVFVDAMKTRGVQIILESHSEHLLRRLQRRIAEEKLSNDDVALYFCEMNGAASELTPLQVDEFGQIVNWPQDFFGNEFGEMTAMARAISRRQQVA